MKVFKMAYSSLVFLQKRQVNCACSHSTFFLKDFNKIVFDTFHQKQLSKSKNCFKRQFTKVHTLNTQFYKILGVSESATQKEIKNAYYELSKRHHPDVSADPKSHIKITEINEAYETLGDETKRLVYDQSNMIGQNQFSGSSSYPNYSNWTRYESTEKYYNYGSGYHNQQKYYTDEYEFSQWYDEKQKDNSERKTRTSNKNRQNIHRMNKQKHSSSKFRNNHKTKSRDRWYYEQEEEYDILNDILRKKSKAKNSQSHQRENSQESKQEKPRDTDHESHYKYYDFILKEHLRKSQNTSRSTHQKHQKPTIFSLNVDIFFQQYEDYKSSKDGKTSTIVNPYDKKIFKLLAKNFDDVLRYIDDEPNRKNRSEYLKTFLQNFKYRKLKKNR